MRRRRAILVFATCFLMMMLIITLVLIAGSGARREECLLRLDVRRSGESTNDTIRTTMTPWTMIKTTSAQTTISARGASAQGAGSRTPPTARGRARCNNTSGERAPSGGGFGVSSTACAVVTFMVSLLFETHLQSLVKKSQSLSPFTPPSATGAALLESSQTRSSRSSMRRTWCGGRRQRLGGCLAP